MQDQYSGAFSDSDDDSDDSDAPDFLGAVGWVNLQPLNRNADLLNFFFGASVTPQEEEELGGADGRGGDSTSASGMRGFVGRFNRLMLEMSRDPPRAGPGRAAHVAATGGGGDIKSPLLPVSMASDTEVVEPPPLEVSELAPAYFALIRTACGILPADFLAEMKLNLDDFKSKARFSEGASNAFLCFSGNNAFLLKTLTEGEVATLRNMLPAYTKHICGNPDTLLTKILMCIRIKFYHQPFYLVAMSNCMHTPEDVHQRFDLKGSWVNRSANKSRGVQPSLRQAYEDDPTRLAGNVLLDNDLNFRLRLRRDLAQGLAKQCIRDSALLRRAGIMDYSLLLGVHRTRLALHSALKGQSVHGQTGTAMLGGEQLSAFLPPAGVGGGHNAGDSTANPPIRRANNMTADEVLSEHSPFRRGEFNAVSPGAVEGPGRYYLGIIDILQEWNWNKRAEHFLKTKILCKPRAGLSAVPPDEYFERFKRRIAYQVIFPSQDDSLQHLSLSAVRAEQRRRAEASAPKGPWQALTSAIKQLLMLE
jgi:hypothetical protein